MIALLSLAACGPDAELLQAVIDTVDESKRSELGKAIATEVAKGCE